MYTPNTIDKVREADIVKTIQGYVQLKKEGANYKGLSPFVTEKTPSFVVSPSKQIFKCFSSGNGGDGISFIRKQESVEFIDAIEIIAKIHHISLEKHQESEVAKRTRIAKQSLEEYSFLASSVYKQNYVKLPAKHWAKKLIAERKYSDEITIDFQIGFASLSNDITKNSQETNNFENAKKLGLCKTKEGKTFDMFKKRIMFPILNHKGKVVGFGGRKSNLDEDEKFPKYLNSKESDIFNKSGVLYGLWQAKQDISKEGYAILTEGYTDVIALHQANCSVSIATLGTALTEEHLVLLKKYCKHLVLLRDADKAGFEATIKDIKLAIEAGFTVDVCQLPEGEDPDSFSRKDNDIKAWIQATKKDAVYWYTNFLFSDENTTRDNYQRDIDNLNDVLQINIDSLKSDLTDISKLKEADEITVAKKHNNALLKEIEVLKKEHKKEEKNVVKYDVRKRSMSLSKICFVLFRIKKEATRNEYIRHVAKVTGFTPSVLKVEIGNLEKEATDNRLQKDGKFKSAKKNLPKGADQEEYNQFGFVTVNNSYYFEDQRGNFFCGSNFVFNPLYHIIGRKENKRVVELINETSKRRLIDFDSTMLANFGEFKRELYKLGGFRFKVENGTRNEHFERFVGRYDQEFEPAKELHTMGWNPQGFWAFADGIYYKNEFKKVNKYGIVCLDGIDNDVDEYNEAIENYFSPAFSVMHRKNDEGDDPYENDRAFVYKKSPVSLLEWQQQMLVVFKEKAFIGISFVLASCFRDIFLKQYKSFPLLGCFGEKDSGKSTFGQILQDFFYTDLKPLDLSQSTHVGFNRRVSRCYNTIVALDEYSDKNVDPKIQQGVMGGYNGLGREKGMNTSDKRTTNDRINSALVYMGQWLPSIFDNALSTRTIAMMFPSNKFTAAQKEQFNKLVDWMNAGVSSLVLEIIEHRTYFENQLPIVYAEVTRELKDELKEQDYQERILEGIIKLITTVEILKDKIDIGFDFKEFREICVKTIIENSEQITDSNGVSEFWKILQWLFEHGRIQELVHFKIEQTPHITCKKNELDYQNTKGDKILYLRLSSVHQDYVKEASLRDGIDVIGETTIRNYFKSRSYFIGKKKDKKFKNGNGHINSSCFVFNYTRMEENNVVTLVREESPQQSIL
ncbi:DNA primase [Tenacibaculum sp. nBUS_03]|uniref:DNA primase n=1 Tax=Tenacibaculum sp. nBUS_03 TaxID=3395320 RepID=UPI003EB74409